MTQKDKIRAEIERVHANTRYVKAASFTRKTLRSILHFIDSMPEEPVSEDLDIAASQYVLDPNNFVDWIGNHGETDDISYILRAYKTGADWQKQQMMNGAINAEVGQGKNLIIPTLNYTLDSMKMNPGDKVKIIIVKEE